MHRFFVPPECVQQDVVQLGGALAHQLSRVLRLSAGDRIQLLDGSGQAWDVVLDTVLPRGVAGHVVTTTTHDVEPRHRLTLCHSLPKGRKLDWVLQKGTELGVSAFVPMITRHTIVQSSEGWDSKMARWQRIVTEAAEQSGRTRLPQVAPPQEFDQVCTPPAANSLSLMACLDERSQSLRTLVQERQGDDLGDLRLLVGPEGGFAPEEVDLALQAGNSLISLGPRILRTETAALAAVTALFYALGELD